MPEKTINRQMISRLLLLVVLVGIILGFAVYQGHAIIDGGQQRGYRIRSGRAIVEPTDRSRFIRSYPVTFNGQSTEFAHYASDLPAERVIAEYRRWVSRDRRSKPVDHIPGLGADGAGCSVFSYVTEDSRVIGIIAFDNRQTGGSDYFVGSMKIDDTPEEAGAESPGREPPGVPKPRMARRTLCIENLGGVDSMIVGYDAWGSPSGIVSDFQRGMEKNGWTERAESSQLLTENYQGFALLSFSRGHEQCIVAIDRLPDSGKMKVLVLWADRPWLPEGLAL